MKRAQYVIHVRQEMSAWGVQEVEADSEEQAREIAEEEFEFDWSNSHVDKVTSVVLSKEELVTERSNDSDGAGTADDDKSKQTTALVTATKAEAKFSLGRIVATPGALELLTPEEITDALARHVRGDWGDVCPEDWQENELSLREEGRLMSVYFSTDGFQVWVITEADRSVTTALVPEEY